MRKRIDALEKDLKAQKEATAADRQKLQTEQAAKLKEVQDAMDALNRAARKSGADLAVDLEKAQNDLAQNRGTLEVLQHRLDQMDQANAERDRRIDENSRFVATKQKELEHPTDKAGLYAAARKKLDAGDTGIARQFLAEFLAKYPKDELAGNAQYWLGETYYAEKRWNEAIVEFQKVLKDHRGSEKTPDALLKIGMAFQNQKDCKNALLFFDEVQQAYKSSPAAKMAREQEAQCKNLKRNALTGEALPALHQPPVQQLLLPGRRADGGGVPAAQEYRARRSGAPSLAAARVHGGEAALQHDAGLRRSVVDGRPLRDLDGDRLHLESDLGHGPAGLQAEPLPWQQSILDPLQERDQVLPGELALGQLLEGERGVHQVPGDEVSGRLLQLVRKQLAVRAAAPEPIDQLVVAEQLAS